MSLGKALEAHPAHARKLVYCETPGPRPRQFFFYQPVSQRVGAPLVVSVHGIARNAAAHGYRLMAEAERFGLSIVAPLFDQAQYGQYQQLQDPKTGVRADLAVLDIVEAARRSAPVRTDKLLLFGFSGGAQFTHRFTLAHPDRVLSAVHVSAGWYTFPDPRRAFPLGVGPPEQELGFTLDLDGALRVPQHVLVGEQDIERDASLRQSKRLDRLQGPTRLLRARNWVAAMSEAAHAHVDAIAPTISILPFVGHGFIDAVETASLPKLIFERFAHDAHLTPVAGL